MHWKLVYRSEALGEAWQDYFGPAGDVEILAGDICQVDCDALVSPANSFGFMDGGLDLAISNRFGWDLEKRVQEEISKRPLGELLVGEALIVETGDEAVPWLISAPTMRVPMVLRQTVNAYLAMKAILTTVMAHEPKGSINCIAVPGLGTGCGCLSTETSAFQMWTAYREVVLGEVDFPKEYSDAQRNHITLNPAQINLWDI